MRKQLFLYFLFCCLCLYLSPKVKAQILNADRFSALLDSTHHWKGNFNLGVNLNKRKTVILSVLSKLEMSYWHPKHHNILYGQFKLLRSNGENLLNSGFVHYRFRALPKKRLHPEFFLQYQMTGILGLENRALTGINLRYRFYDNPEKGNLYFGLGAMYELEEWNYSAVEEDRLPLDIDNQINNYIKVNAYLSFLHKIKDNVSFQSVIYLQARGDSYILKPRISTDSRLLFKINKHFSFSCSFNLAYDSLPIVPIDKTYYTLTNSIVVTW